MFQLNLCSSLPDSVCGKLGTVSAAVCAKDSGDTGYTAFAGLHGNLEFVMDGQLRLTYMGTDDPGSFSIHQFVLVLDIIDSSFVEIRRNKINY